MNLHEAIFPFEETTFIIASPGFTTDTLALRYRIPPFLRQSEYFSGEAQPSEKRRRDKVINPVDIRIFADYRPDLALFGADQPVQVGCDKRNDRTLMRIRKASLRNEFHHGRLKPVSAARAVFNDQFGSNSPCTCRLQLRQC